MNKVITLCFSAVTLTACAPTASTSQPEPAHKAALGSAMDNPFLAASWDTPFGTPPFGLITEAHYAPAFDAGMQQQLEEIAAIVEQTEAPTFANTIEAIERSGSLLERVDRVFESVSLAESTEGIEAIRQEYAPKLSMHDDAIYLDQGLYARVKAVFDAKDTLNLDPAQSKLLTDYHRRFVRAGAHLDAAKRKRLTEINARLAALQTLFGDNVRKENANYLLLVSDKNDLDGLPEEVVAAAATLARERGHPGKWAFGLVRSSINPFLSYAKNRQLRKEIYHAYISRGANHNELDNRAAIKEIVVLRAEKANLLGFATFADYQLDGNMAKTPAAAQQLLQQVWAGALARAKRERAELEKLLRADLGAGAKLEPWDWRYYAEQVRKAQYDLSDSELKPYFQVDAVRRGAFATAERLFGITFSEITDRVTRYHPEVKVFEVTNNDGSHVGVLYTDYHPRPGKRGGAWMTQLRMQQKLDHNIRPLVANVGNFPAPAGDKPALLGWDEVETLFHEFGHALHGLLSDVTFNSQAGTNTKRDFVEFPSQILENWAVVPAVIKDYGKHYRTGEAIPDSVISKIKAAATFNQGFAQTEYTAAALLDLAWHTKTREELAAIDDVLAFEGQVMAEIGIIDEIAPRYHSPYFQHIFAGDDYASGYYVYLWAQVLEADAFKAFEERGDPFDPELAGKLRHFIFSAGGSDEEMNLYVKFRGHEPTVEPLLNKLGLTD